jgi:hypothetical protein
MPSIKVVPTSDASRIGYNRCSCVATKEHWDRTHNAKDAVL